MWQRFTERARRVVFYAQEEASRLGENYVSTEHLLLGLVREDDCVGARILDRMGVSCGRVRSEIERQVAKGDGRMGQDMQLTPRAKRVIDLAYDEARQLNNNYIGSEHLLLGLIREGEGMAGRVLSKLGVGLERTRAEVEWLQNKELKPAPPVDRPDETAARIGDLGVVVAPEGRTLTVGFAVDETTLPLLERTLEARDAIGYREFFQAGVILGIDAGVAAKLLRFRGGPARTIEVRLLDGKHAGKAVWIDPARWQRTGPDDASFPPDVFDLIDLPELDPPSSEPSSEPSSPEATD